MRQTLVALLVVAIVSQALEKKDLLINAGQKAFNQAFCDCVNQRICDQNFHSTNITGFSNTSIIDNPYGIKNIKSFIFHSTSNYSFPYLPRSQNISTAGVLYMPDKEGLSNQTINGVVFYFHPTTFGRYNGPSRRTNIWNALGALYASHNYAFIASDYLGYNSDAELPHPYVLYPEQILRTAVSALNQLQPTISLQYFQKDLDLYTAGYSEGGAYSIWFSKCFDSGNLCNCSGLKGYDLNEHYKLQKSAGLEGAFDLKEQFKFLRANVTTLNGNSFRILQEQISNLGKPGLTAIAMISYLFYSLGEKQFQGYFSNDFYQMRKQKDVKYKCSCQLEGQRYNLYDILNQQIDIEQQRIALAIGCCSLNQDTKTSPNEKYVGTSISDISLGSRNSIDALVDKSIFDSDTFKNSVEAASIVNYSAKATKKIFIFTLEKDSLVTPLNAQNFVLAKQGNTNVQNLTFINKQYQRCQGGFYGFPVDHIGAQTLANVFALKFFDKTQ